MVSYPCLPFDGKLYETLPGICLGADGRLASWGVAHPHDPMRQLVGSGALGMADL